jgi:hypothetical protein
MFDIGEASRDCKLLSWIADEKSRSHGQSDRSAAIEELSPPWRCPKRAMSAIRTTARVAVRLIMVAILLWLGSMRVRQPKSVGIRVHALSAQHAADFGCPQLPGMIVDCMAPVRLRATRAGWTLNGTVVSSGDLGRALADIYSKRAEHSAFVSADAELDFDDVVQMLDTVRGAVPDVEFFLLPSAGGTP